MKSHPNLTLPESCKSNRRSKWIGAATAIALLPACVLLEWPLIAVTLVAATAAFLLFGPGRSLVSAAAAICLTLAFVTAALWGQSLWADIAKTWQAGSDYYNVQISPRFIHLSHAYSGVAPGGTANPPSGIFGRVDDLVIEPWLPTAAFMSCAFLLILVGRALRYRARALMEFRLRECLCVACGYDLAGNLSGRCPECGVAAGSSKTMES